MDFTIEHQTVKYMRLRLRSGKFTKAERDVLTYALGHMKGVTKTELFPSSGGIILYYDGDREEILRKLRALRFTNVKLFAEKKETDDGTLRRGPISRTSSGKACSKEEGRIGREELRRRDLSPVVKRRLRTRILLETAADIFLPMPVQVGYHVYQLVSLEEM